MAQKEMRIDKPYLNLPVRPDAPIAWVNWERPDGGLLYELYAELDFDDPAYYVPCHVERWMGALQQRPRCFSITRRRADSPAARRAARPPSA